MKFLSHHSNLTLSAYPPNLHPNHNPFTANLLFLRRGVSKYFPHQSNLTPLAYPTMLPINHNPFTFNFLIIGRNDVVSHAVSFMIAETKSIKISLTLA